MISGAKVVVTDSATGVATQLVTAKDGSYSALLLNPGTYKVGAEQSGFSERSAPEWL
jgi:hypothetical protein